MIQPTRTNLLYLRDRAISVANSIAILRTKRQALLAEFLRSTRPFLRTRNEVRDMYGKALAELALSVGHDGRAAVESIAVSTGREPAVDIIEGHVWGLRYRDVMLHDSPVRSPEKRHYDWRSSTHHMEECIHLFEKLLEEIVKVAAFESKLKRLAEEIRRTTRRMRVLEERVLPGVKADIRAIGQFIEEREREAYCRLKRAKSRKCSSSPDKSARQ